MREPWESPTGMHGPSRARTHHVLTNDPHTILNHSSHPIIVAARRMPTIYTRAVAAGSGATAAGQAHDYCRDGILSPACAAV